MSLQFILGPAGSGKSRKMYTDLTREAAQHLDRHYYVIVPEQFNMQTQRELVRCSPNGGILNIDVFSFSRLAQRVFEETGTDPGMVLTETGKSLILRRCAEQVRDELVLMGGRLDREGYIARLKSILSEFAQYNIDDDELDHMIEMSAARPMLQRKLKDVRTIRRAFDRFCSGSLTTAQDMLKVFADVIPDSTLLEGSTLVFDGFTGFTPVQMLLLEQMLKKAAHVRIALDKDGCADLPPLRRRHDLFALSAQTVHGLSTLAAGAGVEICESVLMPCSRRYGERTRLAHLERSLLRYKTQEMEGGRAEDESLQVCAFHTPLDETISAADLIWHLTSSGEYRYRDIAVITADPDTYNNQIGRIFEAYGIPFFLDQKQAVKANSAVQMICSALGIVEENYSYESIFRFLRCGYTVLTDGQIDLMENYVLAFGVRGKLRWTKPWDRTSQYLDEQCTARCEEARAQLMRQLGAFLDMAQPSRGKAADYVAAVRRLCEDLHLRELLEQKSTAEEQYEDTDSVLERPPHLKRRAAMEFAQIGEILEEILTQMTTLIGEECVSRSEFVRILEAGFDEASTGVIPPSADQVHVGDLVRSRLSHIRVLLFLGANDTVIPARERSGGIITQEEKRFLTDRGIALSPDERENGYIQRFYLYQCLTKPSDRLRISYALSDRDGKSLRPSYLIYHIGRLFPDLPVTYNQADGSQGDLLSLPEGMRRLGVRLREAALTGVYDNTTRELLRWYSTSPQYAPAVRVLLRAQGGADREASLQTKTAEKLYGDTLHLSVSRIETYAQCPFRFYAEYGLGLRERQHMQIQAADTGSFMHEVMKRFSQRVTAMPGDAWHTLTDGQALRILDESMSEELGKDERGRNLFGDSARNQYTVQRLKRALVRTVWASLQQIRQSDLIPTQFEMMFREEIDQPEGRIALTGIVDRIDLSVTDQEAVLKVVDYKSSAHRMSLSGLLYGDSLQLTEYLYQALRLLERDYPEHEVIPAGLFYAPMIDPVPETGRDSLLIDSAQRDDEVFLRMVRPEGMVNADERILGMLDRDLSPGSTSLYIPVSLKKDGTPKEAGKMPHTATASQLRTAAQYTDYKIRQFARQIRSGRIEISPLHRSTQQNACSWCLYADACQFDPRLAGCDYRRVKEIEAAQFWEIAQRSLDEEKERRRIADEPLKEEE